MTAGTNPGLPSAGTYPGIRYMPSNVVAFWFVVNKVFLYHKGSINYAHLRLFTFINLHNNELWKIKCAGEAIFVYGFNTDLFLCIMPHTLRNTEGIIKGSLTLKMGQSSKKKFHS